MFKVKKHSKRALPDRNTLVEANHNQVLPPPLPDKSYKRPQSVKPYRKQIFEPLQSSDMPSDQLQPSLISQPCQSKIFDRESVSEEVRRLSTMMFKDRMATFGLFKQEMIRKVTEKCLVMVQPEMYERKEWIESLIQKQMGKLQLVKQTNTKYEKSLNRIQEMLAQRISKLSAFR